ncbi:MAG: amino acid adenylation domain-containing protein [Moraxellaceae bacterium]|nr:amino acid adenylation domain-containing protein [Moraxellaceae bacterium]
MSDAADPATAAARLQALTPQQRALLARRLQQSRSAGSSGDGGNSDSASNAIVARDRSATQRFATSAAQRRFWLLDQWNPGSATYNLHLVSHLAGPLDQGALQAAFDAILRRHEVLQMTYAPAAGTDDGDVVCVRHPAPAIPIAHRTLDTPAGTDTGAAVEAFVQAEIRRPFDLAAGLPWRVTLLALSPTEHYLIVVMHHIVGDMWSLRILTRELEALYNAAVSGVAHEALSSALPPLPVQYMDYADWQREPAQQARLSAQLDYWRDTLNGAPPRLTLTSDYPRPVEQGYRGDTLEFELPASLNDAVRSAAASAATTPFVIMLSAFALLMGRHARSEDVVIGSPVAGRTQRAVEDLIGLFINTLALRVDLSGDPDVATLWQRVRERVAGAMAHQELPFERVIEALQVERDLSCSPVFQVMFNYQSITKTPSALKGLEVTPFMRHNGSTKFDLNVSVKQLPDRLLCAITWDTALFRPESIARMVDHFRNLLTQMTAQPQASLSSLDMLSATERSVLLDDWSCAERRSHPAGKALHHLFEAQTRAHPGRTAVVAQGRRLRYDELDARANQLAHALIAAGVQRGDRVGLFMSRSAELLVGLLGILKAGAAYVPLDPLFPAERIGLIVEDAGIALMLTEVALRDRVPAGPDCLLLDEAGSRARLDAMPSSAPEIACAPDDLLYILYTSGSTGRPKGVAVEHGHYLHYYHGIMARMALPEGLRYAIASTFAADLATINVWAALSTGGEIHVLSHDEAVDPLRYATYFRTHGIDVIKMVPSHFKALMDGAPLADIVPRRLLVLAGEASDWPLIETIRSACPDTALQIHYGPTETTVSMLAYAVPATRPVQHTSTLPLGRPIANTRIYVLDERLQPVPAGVPGELCIAGPGVARGYLGQAELTATKFVELRLQGREPDRVYRSGDLVRYLDDGVIEFLGRVDEQVKIRGFRIEPGEIAATLKNLASVHDAFVMARPGDDGQLRLIAWVVPMADNAFDAAMLRAALGERLPPYMLPSAFVALDALPLNANGKVDRAALPAPTDAAPAAGSAPPEGEAEQRVAAVWAEVLGIGDLSDIGRDDDFFSLGGDSFKAVRVVRGLGHTLSILDVFRHPTVRGLASLLAESRSEARVLHHLPRRAPEHAAGDEPASPPLSVIAVPFAGGSAIAYQPLADALPAQHRLYAVQIPGHDFSRPDDAPQSIETVAERCVQEFLADASAAAGKVVVYGHCLGGALALEIATQLEAAGVALVGVCMGGNFPVPQLPGKLFQWWQRVFPRDRRLSNRAYMDLLRSLGGFQEDLDPRERDFIIESLRHDRRESERYFAARYDEAQPRQLRAPIFCVVGELDRTTEFHGEQVDDWRAFSPQVELAVIPNAGHYFFKHQARELAELLRDKTAAWLASPSPAGELRMAGATPATAAVTLAPDASRKPSLNTFFLFVLGQFMSMMGSNLSGFAMGLWVYNQSGAFMDFAMTLVFHRLPGILVLPFAGALADRVDRRQILIWTNVCSAVAMAAVAATFWLATLHTWHIYLVVAISSVAAGFQRPAVLAAVAQIAPKRYLGQANGILQLATSSGNVLAPLLGGVLVTMVDLAGIILIDFLSFTFCLLTLLAIRFPAAAFRRAEEPFFTEMAGGWRFIAKRRSFVALVAFFVASNLLLGMANVLITPLVLSFDSTVVLGMVTSANGIGGLIGGIAMGLWGGTRRRAEGMVGFGVVMGLSYVVMGLQPSATLVMSGMFAYGVSLALVNAHWQTLIQAKVRAELLGRVFSINQLFALPSIPLGYFIGGWLSDHVFKTLFVDHPALQSALGWLVGSGADRGIGLLFVLVGLAMTAWSLLGMQYRPLRYMDDIIPDAVPGPVFVRDRAQIQANEDRELARIRERTQHVLDGHAATRKRTGQDASGKSATTRTPEASFDDELEEILEEGLEATR